jgi:SagB-type dehydrogenase family enzyme
MDRLARLYHDNTSLTEKTAARYVASIDSSHAVSPRPFGYPFLPRIPLERSTCRIRLDKATASRRSTRDFSDKTVSFKSISALFTTALCTGARKDDGLVQRPYPSAGALYPVNCYLIARRVERLVPGIYHINGDAASLEVVRTYESRPDALAQVIDTALVTDPAIRGAAFFVLLTGNLDKVTAKYGERGYRFLLLEAGHIAQNLSLAAAGCRLTHVAVGGFCEAALEQLVGVREYDHLALYLLAFGAE